MYAHDVTGTKIYASFTSGSNIYHWENIVLQNIGTPITEVYISDLNQAGSTELDYDYIEILPISHNGRAITGRWSELYDPLYNWYARIYIDTVGTHDITVYAYQNSDAISTQYVRKTLVGSGWFNIDVGSLLNYEKNTLGLTFSQLRVFSEYPKDIAELQLRKEVNDTEPPVINLSSCVIRNEDTEIEQYTFGCLDTIEFECQITDNIEVDVVKATINDVNVTFTQDPLPTLHWDTYITPTANGTIVYNWTKVIAEDIVGLKTTGNVNKVATYTCIYEDYINIIHTGTPQVDQINLTPTSVVIEWDTSNPSDTDVDFGLSPDNLTEEFYNGNLVTHHIMPLTGLTPNTTYYYKVSSSVNPTQTLTGFSFTTPPVQTQITVLAGVYNATINSTTNLPVNSTIYYDENGTYSLVNQDPTESYTHTHFLDNLLPLTTYFVQHIVCREDPSQCFTYYYNFTTNTDCVENWVEDPYTCQTDDEYFSTFTDSNACDTTFNLPPTNGTYQFCNYCSDDMFQLLGVCQQGGFQTVDYYDNNYISCCQVTGLISDCSILYYPYNETTTQECLFYNNTMGDIDCEDLPNFDGYEKEYCLAHIPNEYLNNTFKCISFVTDIESLKIIQTNPEYRERTTTLVDWFRQDPESREYFEPANALVNFYYTSKNLLPEHQYLLTLECSSTQETISSSMPFEMRYEDYEFVFFRTKWLMGNAGYIIAGVIVAFLVIAILWWIFRGAFR